jgi:hypothetical protein
VLDDGIYDVFVVDATFEGGTATLELTVLAGQHKGEVVSVSAPATTFGVGELQRGEIDLLGMPGTLTVENGVPRVFIEA